MAEVEIVARVERRRTWSEVEKAALLAEVEAEGGKVSAVAKRHGISDSLIYNWRAALKAAVQSAPEPMAFVPIGVMGRADDGGPALLAAPEPPRPERSGSRGQDRVGMIEVDLPGGTRLRVDAFVNERALRRVLLALKDGT